MDVVTARGLVFVIALGGLLATGCEYLEKKATEVAKSAIDKIPGKKESETVAGELLGALSRGDWQQASTYYAPEYLQKTTPEQYAKEMERVRERLGDLKGYDLHSWNGKADESGTSVEMGYKLNYTKGPAEMQLILKKPKGGGAMKVVEHRLLADPRS